MKKLTILTGLAVALTLPSPTHAWVAAGGYHGAYGYHGATYWHGGYSCGGVSTGTAVAAGFAGLAVGAMVGSAAAKSSQPTYVVAPPVVYAPAPYVYAAPPVVVPSSAPVGGIYYSLPPGSQSANINGTQYYVLGNTYFQPQFGNNGVYYQVVPNPI